MKAHCNIQTSLIEVLILMCGVDKYQTIMCFALIATIILCLSLTYFTAFPDSNL